MAEAIELTAEMRSDVGKGASRRLRRDADLVPAVMYGAGKDTVSLSIKHKDLHKACETEAFFSQIITIVTGNDKTPAIVKDVQRHPARDRILHADFFRISMDQEITVEIPLHFVNEDTCVGVRQHNGQVSHNISSVEISCLPGDLPEYIEVDIQSLDIGDTIHLSEIRLPQGTRIPALELEDYQDQVVVSVHEEREIIEEEEEAPEAGEVGLVGEEESEGEESEDTGSSDETESSDDD